MRVYVCTYIYTYIVCLRLHHVYLRGPDVSSFPSSQGPPFSMRTSVLPLLSQPECIRFRAWPTGNEDEDDE